jgi:hypothetical protein
MAHAPQALDDLPYRQKLKPTFPKVYNGYLHFATANAFAITAITVSVSQLDPVHPLEWLTLPVAFFFANFVEWFAHRGPMHNKVDWMEIVFKRHTLSHHEYFREDSMPATSHRDWYYVLFPVWGIFPIFLPALPIMALAWWLISHNVALLFFATAAFYFIFYEWMHLIYHLPETNPLVRNRLVRYLQRHHRHHHNKRLMQKYNFNVTFPLSDYLFGTAYREKANTAAAPGKRSED